jgi:putative membrane protein
MKKYTHYLLIAASLFVISCGQSDAKKEKAQEAALADTVKTTDVLQINTDDAGFVHKAASGSMLEIQLGQLAQRNALNQKVKEFGAMMVKDHTKASVELKNLANGKKLGLPVTLDKDTQDRVDSLSLQSSAGFDLKFMEVMVAAHKKDVAEFEKATTTLKDPDLKAFAVKTLPVLKMHLTHAEALNAEINKKNAANNNKM